MHAKNIANTFSHVHHYDKYTRTHYVSCCKDIARRYRFYRGALYLRVLSLTTSGGALIDVGEWKLYNRSAIVRINVYLLLYTIFTLRA